MESVIVQGKFIGVNDKFAYYIVMKDVILIVIQLHLHSFGNM